MIELQALESILKRLLVPDNAVIEEATSELKKAFENPNIFEFLCQLLTSSNEEQVRQYASILLMRKFSKAQKWFSLSNEIRSSIKNCLIKHLTVEYRKSVQNSVAQLIGTISKHELPNGTWDELIQILINAVQSNEDKEKEIGLYVLHAVLSSSVEHLRPVFKQFLNLLNNHLSTLKNAIQLSYAMKSLTCIAPYIGTEEIKCFQNLIPKSIQVIKYLLIEDESLACNAMELYDELIECEVSIIVPYIKIIIETCLEISKNENLENETRTKGMSFISLLIKYKKKTVIKQNLIPTILDTLYPIICQKQIENEDEDDSFLNAESDNPSTYAIQVVDMMALHLPPQKLFKTLLKHVQPSLESDDPYQQRAAFVVMAVVSEGCSDLIRKSYLKPFLPCIFKGITTGHIIAKNGALYALGQFSEHLQPDISKNAAEIMPILFNYLSCICHQMVNGGKDPANLTKTFYALETFCDNLDSDLVPYLPILMERLFGFLVSNTTVRVKELSISSIGAAVNAVKEDILPYFPSIIDHIKPYLTTKEEDLLHVQIQAIETYGICARNIGISNFYPFAHESMEYGMSVIEGCEDPDLRRCTYGFFASVSLVLKEEIEKYIPVIVDKMIETLTSTEGVVPQYSQETTAFPDFDSDNDEENIDQDQSITCFNVENAYLDEKEDTCTALKEICSNSRSVFIPYMDKCCEEILSLIDHPGCDVRKAAIESITQFVITFYEVIKDQNDETKISNLLGMIETLILKFSQIIEKDVERNVVMAALEGYTKLLNSPGKFVVQNLDHIDVMSRSIKSVMLRKAACQDDMEDEDECDDEAEYDTMLIEYAGEVIPALAKVCSAEVFAPYFAGMMPHLAARMKDSCTVPEKSFAMGTVAEVIEGMKDGIKPFTQHLLSVFFNGVKDDDDEVRSNAVYGLGLLIQHCGEQLHSQYPLILQVISRMLSREDCPKPLDNICGTLARMILSDTSIMPIKQVLPTFLDTLPLREDFEENKFVYKSLLCLLSLKHEQLFLHVSKIFDIFSKAISSNKLDDESKITMKQFIESLNQDFNEKFNLAINSLDKDSVAILNTFMSC